MRGLLLDQRAQPVRNIHPRGTTPSFGNGWGAQTPSGNTVTTETTAGPTGGPALKVVTSVAGQLRMQHNDNNGARRIPVVAGQTYTIAAWVYSPKALANVTFETQTLDASNAGGFASGTAFSVVAGWQFVRSIYTIPAGRTTIAQCQLLTPNNVVAAGETYMMARAMIVPGAYLGDYCDGSTPGWKWLGAAGASESVGWPYTLESVAGRPRWDAEFPPLGTYLPGTFGEHTSFAYGDVLTSGQKGWLSSIALAGAVRWETLNISTSARFPYVRAQNGPTPGGQASGPTPSVPNAIIAGYWTADGGIGIRSYDVTTTEWTQGAQPGRVPPAGGYQLRSGVRDTVTSNGLSMARQVVYDRVLSASDRLAVARWFANRYGVVLAA